ncbi:carboxymethylenebutenolidase homolog isoform X2 [Denticeps clupeoides]|uniref:carboxymethylenebutenolidase homolog isoform X2 n=1 Tax=Denticeps clupeoides TaxID=299321 RepID=UPI0010A46AFD|nr:carboxymethylenebutenolidase homolog isoform X2 [Denticeps clupeoides]
MANEAKPCPCDIGDRMEYGGLGQEVQIQHVKAYVVKPPAASEKAVIVIQDIFGWGLPNTRYMADMLSANGYTAVVPDFFLGKEPWSPSHDWSKFQEWLEDKKPTNINKEVDVVLKFLREQCGASRIATVGFCWGIIRDREDRYELKSPTLFIFAEKDEVIPLDQVTVLEKNLHDKSSADFQVKIFPGQTHGFVHRKRDDINPADKPLIEEARLDMLNWLRQYM